MSPIRRQFVYTLLLLPVTFGLWYAAGSLFAAPAVWIFDQIVMWWLPEHIDTVALQDTTLVVATLWGQLDGTIIASSLAGNQLIVDIDTRLVSYGIALYGALLIAQAEENGLLHFCTGLVILWGVMALGFPAMLGKDLMLGVGAAFLELPQVPPASVIALLYQFSVLLAPTLIPVGIWVIQLRGSPLWEALSADVRSATGAD